MCTSTKRVTVVCDGDNCVRVLTRHSLKQLKASRLFPFLRNIQSILEGESESDSSAASDELEYERYSLKIIRNEEYEAGGDASEESLWRREGGVRNVYDSRRTRMNVCIQ